MCRVQYSTLEMMAVELVGWENNEPALLCAIFSRGTCGNFRHCQMWSKGRFLLSLLPKLKCYVCMYDFDGFE